MKNYIKTLTELWKFRSRQEKIVALLITVVLFVVISKTMFPSKDISEASDSPSANSTSTPLTNIVVGTVGEGESFSSGSLDNSWPGEIISLGNTFVQPQREGTIVEWRVRIGQWVDAGDVIGKLSAPPVMPELTKMLAEQAESLARMRASAAANKTYTEQVKSQLISLSSSLDNTYGEGQNGAKSNAKISLEQAQSSANTMKQGLLTFIEQVLGKHMLMLSNVTDPRAFRYGSLNRSYGILNIVAQNRYEVLVLKLVAELNVPDSLPVDTAKDYFAEAVKIANFTPESPDMADIRPMMRMDQENFLKMLGDYRTEESMVSMKEADYKLMYAKEQKEIGMEVADLDKEYAMSQADVKAAEASYDTVSRSVNGGVYIIAPRSGVISTIQKKVGDFVGPGMGIAYINTGDASERFVRIRIPSNVRLPKAGSIFRVMRPGFSEDVRNVKLTGVGTSLDESGSYMADAEFLDSVDWPVGASVRVIKASSDSSSILVRSSAIWRNAEGNPMVWKISEVGRIFAKEIKLGRTLGSNIEVYEGLADGDRYIATSNASVREDVMLKDILPKEVAPAKSNGGSGKMGGMEM